MNILHLVNLETFPEQPTWLGSLLRHFETKSLKILLKPSPSSGGSAFGIWKRTFMGWRSEFGGWPLASSIAVMPKLHMSAWNWGGIKGIIKKSNYVFLMQSQKLFLHQLSLCHLIIAIIDISLMVRQIKYIVVTLESYGTCLMTSGAIQNGVPTKVSLLLMVLPSWPATPKSASFTSPDSESKMFAAVGPNKHIIGLINKKCSFHMQAEHN